MLKGSLEVLNLSDILQSLSQNKHTGTLVVTDGKREKLIYFAEGEIALFSSDKRLKIGELLVNAGKLAREDLEFALNQQDNLASGANTQQLKLGEILVEEGFVTQDDIHEIVKSQIEEEIYDLFLWKKADFEFLIDYCPDKLRRPSCNVTTLQFNTNSLIMEAARRLDEWDLITKEIPSLKEVYKQTPACNSVVADLDLPRHVREEIHRVDGYHTIEQIAEQSTITKFELCRLLYEVKNHGGLEPLTPQELSDRAEELGRQGRFRESAALYERLAEMLPKNLGIRRTYAEALKAFGDEKRAIQQYELMAQQLEQRRERPELARVLKSILELDPERKDLHEKLRQLGRVGFGATFARVAASVAILTPLTLVVAAWVLSPDDFRSILKNLVRLADSKPQPVADAEEVTARQLYEKGRELVRLGRLEEAWQKLRDVVDSYPNTGAAKSVRLPIEVETNPPGKLVRLNGEPQGRTPTVVYYLPGEKSLTLEIGDIDQVPRSRTLDPEAFHKVVEDFRRDPKWAVATDGPIRARPLIHRGVVYAVSWAGRVRGVRLSDQQVVFEASLRDGDADPIGEVTSAAAAVGDILAVGTLDGTVLSFDLGKRERRKRPRVSEQPLLTTPAAAGSLIAFVSSAGDFVLYDPVQNAPAKSAPLFANEVRADLVVLGNLCYVASTDNRLLAIEIGDPRQLLSVRWQHDVGVDLVATPCAQDDVVLVGDVQGRLWCLTASNGQPRWAPRELGAPVVGLAAQRGYGLVTTADGRLHCVDLATGNTEWQATLDGPPSAPVVAKRAVYVVTAKGTLYALDYLSKGASLWTGAVGAAPGTGLLLHEDLLLVGGEDGRLYCFALD